MTEMFTKKSHNHGLERHCKLLVCNSEIQLQLAFSCFWCSQKKRRTRELEETEKEFVLGTLTLLGN